MKIKNLIVISIALVLVVTCTHDPVIPEIIPNVNDSTDTTGNNGNNCDSTIVYFENDILPIFLSNCAFSPCHDAATQQSNLDLSNYNGIMTEITPSNLGESDIYERITENDPDKLMPRIVGQQTGQSLDLADINLIQQWISQGAQNNKCETCDTSSVSFSNDLIEIFQRSCNTSSSCHGTGSTRPTWDNYQTIKNNINKIENRVILGVGNPMPPSGPLPDCDLNQLKAWINNGSQNN